MKNRKGFTLIELMVVILIVAILAAVAIPILRGRIESAKWSEGAAIAGTIRTAAKVAYAEDSSAANIAALTAAVTGIMSDLGFEAGDLDGQYFDDSHFTITGFDAGGNATISVTAPTGLSGSGVLGVNGWVYTPGLVCPCF